MTTCRLMVERIDGGVFVATVYDDVGQVTRAEAVTPDEAVTRAQAGARSRIEGPVEFVRYDVESDDRR